MKRDVIPFWKIAATAGGLALTGSAVWLNAEHVAASEGGASPLVLAGVIVTICAAVTPPFAERAFKTGQWGKGTVLWLFFTMAVAFSLTASITRSSAHRDDQVAGAELVNTKARLAQEAYADALLTRVTECKSGRGAKCRAAEASLAAARMVLAAAPAVKAADPGAQRMWRPSSACQRPRSVSTARWRCRLVLSWGDSSFWRPAWRRGGVSRQRLWRGPAPRRRRKSKPRP